MSTHLWGHTPRTALSQCRLWGVGIGKVSAQTDGYGFLGGVGREIIPHGIVHNSFYSPQDATRLQHSECLFN